MPTWRCAGDKPVVSCGVLLFVLPIRPHVAAYVHAHGALFAPLLVPLRSVTALDNSILRHNSVLAVGGGGSVTSQGSGGTGSPKGEGSSPNG